MGVFSSLIIETVRYTSNTSLSKLADDVSDRGKSLIGEIQARHSVCSFKLCTIHGISFPSCISPTPRKLC